MNNQVNRMAAPSAVGGKRVVAFVADSETTGYALLDLQYTSPSRDREWCVAVVGYETGDPNGQVTRWSGHYFQSFEAALDVFQQRVKRVVEDAFDRKVR